MTEFENALYERINIAQEEWKKDIKIRIVKWLEEEFLNSIPVCLTPYDEISEIKSEVIWIPFRGYDGDKKVYPLEFERQVKYFSSLKEIEQFAKDIKKLFPSDDIDYHIYDVAAVPLNKFGLEFSLKLDKKSEKNENLTN